MLLRVFSRCCPGCFQGVILDVFQVLSGGVFKVLSRFFKEVILVAFKVFSRVFSRCYLGCFLSVFLLYNFYFFKKISELSFFIYKTYMCLSSLV